MAVNDIPKDVLDRLIAELDEFQVVTTKAGEVAVKSARRVDYQRFQSMAVDDKQKSRALEVLAKASLAYPDAATFDGYLEKYPGISAPVANAALELAGVEAEAEVKKYGRGSAKT